MQAHRSLDSKLTPYPPHYLNSTNAIWKKTEFPLNFFTVLNTLFAFRIS